MYGIKAKLDKAGVSETDTMLASMPRDAFFPHLLRDLKTPVALANGNTGRASSPSN